jgi:hypothetical protein
MGRQPTQQEFPLIAFGFFSFGPLGRDSYEHLGVAGLRLILCPAIIGLGFFLFGPL